MEQLSSFKSVQIRENFTRFSSVKFLVKIKKNIFEIPDNLVEEWMKGRELLIKTGKKDFSGWPVQSIKSPILLRFQNLF